MGSTTVPRTIALDLALGAVSSVEDLIDDGHNASAKSTVNSIERITKTAYQSDEDSVEVTLQDLSAITCESTDMDARAIARDILEEENYW